MKKSGLAVLRLMVLLFCCFSVSWASAQTKVTGTVLDEEGEPLISASVYLKGNRAMATVTDVDGHFMLNVPNLNSTLTVEYVGYTPQDVALNGQSDVTVTLVTDTQVLDEMVVIGYGQAKKATLTGSVSAVGAKELLKAPMQSMSNLLAGKASGMTTLQQSGQPGYDGAQIIIRGVSGFSAASPLVLVDGVERDMNLVNPNDVESVSVLKDAAAAIYGIKGANGVILITTKKGSGAPKISYAGSVSAIKNTAFPEFLNASEFMYYKNKALMMDGFAPLYTADIQQKVFENDPDSPWGETDWFDEIFRTGFMQQHNISASGSTNRVSYYTSIGYMGQEGTIKKTDYSRINARANLDIKVAKNLTFGVTMSGIKTHREAPNSSAFNGQFEINPVRQAASTAPVIKKEWNGYTLAWKDGDAINVNPIAALEKPGYAKLDHWIFNSTFKLEYDFSDLWSYLKGLKVSAFFAYDYDHGESREFSQGYKVLAFNNSTLEAKEETSYAIGMDKVLSRIGDNHWSWQFRPTITYNRDFGKHSVGFIAFIEKQKYYNDMLYAQAKGYISDYPVDITIAPQRKEGVAEPQGSFQNSGMSSFAFRLNYGFDEKYLAEFALRRDGSYVFAPENRWGTFPSVAAAWVISRENFLKDINWLDFLKIRASYGESGSDNIKPFQYNNTYSTATNSYVLGGNAYTQYYTHPVYAFRMLTWAHTKTYNLGLDFDVLHHKLSGEVDVFYKRTDDILEESEGVYPPSLGSYYPKYSNSGAVDNRGFEITLTHQNAVTRDFSYRVRGSFSFARSKVLKQKLTDNYPNYRAILGHPVGERRGFKTLGLFQTQEEIDNYPIAPSGETLLGDIKYADINGDGIISMEHDYVKIGYGQIPEINFSFNIDLNYKDFYLTTLWQGVSHCDYALQGTYESGTIAATVYTSSFGTGNSPKYLIEGAWTPEHTDAKYPRLSTVPRFNNAWESDWWIVNGEYLRLKNIQFGYNVPAKMLRKTPFSSVNVYIAGSNVLTFSHFKYVDPESPSVSNGFYPQQKTYTFGLNVAF